VRIPSRDGKACRLTKMCEHKAATSGRPFFYWTDRWQSESQARGMSLHN
jgi:hypothetical protein